MAEYLGTTLEDAAESVLAMSPLERAELLQRFYTSVGLSGAKDAYEVIKEEIEDEERELKEARERLQEDPEETGEEEDGASFKTTVIAKRHTKKIPHQTGESAFGNECDDQVYILYRSNDVKRLQKVEIYFFRSTSSGFATSGVQS